MLLRSFVRSFIALFSIGAAVGCDSAPVTVAPAAVVENEPPTDEPPICTGLWETYCGPTCTDLRTDPRHCGACGYACASDGVCANGRCIANDHIAGARRTPPPLDPMLPAHSMRCRADHAACGEHCVDLASDLANCGGCGHPCAGRCAMGRCQTGGV